MGMKIDDAIKRYTSNAEYERTHGNLQGCLEFRQLAEWLKELKQLREQTRWILVSERLPEDRQQVFVTRRSGTIGEIIWNTWWHEQTSYPADKVIAWMPLPKQYEPQESEEACI